MPFRVNGCDQSRAEDDEHDRDPKFEPLREPFRHRNLEADYRETHDGKRERMSQSPEQPDRTSSRNASFFADEGCDRNDVIRIGRMLEPKYESDSEDEQN